MCQKNFTANNSSLNDTSYNLRIYLTLVKKKKRREKKFSFDVYYQFCNIS